MTQPLKSGTITALFITALLFASLVTLSLTTALRTLARQQKTLALFRHESQHAFSCALAALREIEEDQTLCINREIPGYRNSHFVVESHKQGTEGELKRAQCSLSIPHKSKIIRASWNLERCSQVIRSHSYRLSF